MKSRAWAMIVRVWGVMKGMCGIIIFLWEVIIGMWGVMMIV
ncbi:hypothetical protein [Petrimonas sp.]